MNETIFDPIRLSIEVSLTAEVFIVCLGLWIGQWIARSRKSVRNVIVETVLMLPLVLPPTVVGFILIIVFGKNSPIGQVIEWVFHQPIIFTFWAAVIAATVVAFPLMLQSVKTGIEGIDQDIEDAARMDGANEWKLFIFVTIPLASRAIVTGAILGFARALGEFGATLMFAGNIPTKTQTIPTAIYVAIDTGHMSIAWILVITTVIISFIMLLVTYVLR
ncbi:molybdate ABC transporter permease subunit [Pullulanibacillus sp. KACC 23026]|uniref:molybdate ABC transporter permease subunit n=1 Tax=Pullulanibacillus sp. KACC 23026 TaxID=3028315 RepID=UPI0023AEFE6B|nr:molybdate ABC transporter permease subunit [Pullulanibacillus sp. KACC 23026]WEG12375.1 molybdate ABC transporter permease subunit [Pullulanibacillus sp. KACC 23026]